jgi:teichuronic acid biosynthesis protein TuaE
MAFVAFFPVVYVLNQALAMGVPIIVLMCIIGLNRKLRIDRWSGEVYVFLSLWLIYSLIGLLWAKDASMALEYTRKVMIYLLTFLVFSQMLSNSRYLKYVPLFFQIVFYGYCLVYAWEMITWKHLPSSRLAGIPLPIPTGVYYNENNSAMFLLLMSPFLTLKTILTSSKLGKLAALAMFLFMIAASAIQSSRLGLLVMLLVGGYYFLRAGNFYRIAVFMMISLSFLAFTKLYPKEYQTVRLVLNYEINNAMSESKSYFMSSSKIRTQLNRESLDMAWKSGLIGLGAGNYEDQMQRSRYHRTAWVLNPHDWWLELLVNFGLLIPLGMLIIFFKWLVRLWQLRNASQAEDYHIYDAYFVSLLTFIPFSIVPSSIKTYYSLWVYFALIHAVCLTHSVRSDGQSQEASQLSATPALAGEIG